MLRSRLLLARSAALLLGAGLFLAARPAAAVEVDAGNGLKLEVAPFANYCAMDESQPAEANLIRTMTAAVGDSMRVVLAFGDCQELVELRQGQRRLLNRFGQILLVAGGGQISRLPDSRPEFLAKVIKPFPTATLDEIAANGEAQWKASRPADAPKPIFAVIGRDEMAVYVGTTSMQGQDSSRTMVAGVAGISLLHQIHMNVNLFSAYDGSAAEGAKVLEELRAQMAAGIADIHFINDDIDMPAPLPVPSRSEWQAMGSTALVGAVIGGLIGGIGALAIVLLRRRKRRSVAAAEAAEAGS
ncbi:hypothetical protein [Zavarzinia compransoris]|uniref:Uncharacterized protein n=1 Tax=Zavarzinia compransoris TaxID=1264899 RepID=A0A317E296_9PROT|nr:hypothetical protein [Zavarzinia compransoris]PWR20534.1 hypothetical protein DKG75_11030 [Zavarzinia compransoris]